MSSWTFDGGFEQSVEKVQSWILKIEFGFECSKLPKDLFFLYI
jgi:hypothetical protein